jgi:hypothetical protein
VGTRDLDPNVEDFLAAVFWLRTRPLRIDDREAVPIFMGRSEWPLGATVLGTESIKTDAGEFRCAHVRLAVRTTGSLGSQKDIDIWFSEDAHHVPVLMDMELTIGHARASLAKMHAGR